MNHTFKARLAMVLATALLTASPVFAETTASTSQPVDLKGKPVNTTENDGAVTESPSLEAEQEAAAKRAAEAVAQGPRGNASAPVPPQQSPAPAEGAREEEALTETAPVEEVDPELKPFLDKPITKIVIEGNKEIKTEDIQTAVISKPVIRGRPGAGSAVHLFPGLVLRPAPYLQGCARRGRSDIPRYGESAVYGLPD